MAVTTTSSRRATHSAILPVVLLSILALIVRLYRLAGPVLRWDEGWSLAHASLPWSQLWQIAVGEWHPPAYVGLLKLWLVAGKSAWNIRYLSVFLGVLLVPLSYKVAKEWSGRERVALLAAGFAVFWPLLVYYGQVTRMYALAALAVLAVAWFALRASSQPSRGNDLGLVLSSLAALYTLYHTIWAVAGLWLYAAILRPRRIPRLIAAGLIASAAYLPWLLSARGTIQARLGGQAALSGGGLAGTLQYIRPTLEGLAFTYSAHRLAGPVFALVLAAGLLLGPFSRAEAKKLLLPLLVVGLSALGTAYAAQTYWFAVRHLVPACAFLGLALAWALDRLAWRWRPLLPVALVALAIVYWPTSSSYVYEKMLEVTGPFDPAEDHRYLSAHAGPNDLVYFNVLARAGWYENQRRPQDARWSYAMRWDPIIEPIERIAARITQDSRSHRRLWFALYKGSFGPNADLVSWLDANLYPAGGVWQGDMLYLACAAPAGAWQDSLRTERFVGGIRLKSARWTANVPAGDACAIELVWEAERPIAGSYKVFVHATDAAGQPLAQHDGIPAGGARPTDSWQPGVEALDRHGLFLPAPGPEVPQQLHIRVGLYDPDTGERLHLENGADSVDLGTITLQQAPGYP